MTFGLYRGVVADIADPLNQFRIKATVPALTGTAATGWAWPVDRRQPPPVGAGVWIAFENGDLSQPIWLGSFGPNAPIGGVGGGGTGPTGPTGPSGPTGPTGPTGPAGTDITSISIGTSEPSEPFDFWVDTDDASGGALYVIDEVYKASIGDGVSTSITVTHMLSTEDVLVFVRESTGLKRFVTVETRIVDANHVTLLFDAAPAVGAYRVVVKANVVTPSAPSVDLTPYLKIADQTGNRNRIINGDFSVNQRGFTSTTTNAVYGFDRWFMGCSGGTNTYSAQSFSPGAFPGSPGAFARVVTTGQSASGNYATLEQRIESVRTLSGQTATVSFWARAGSGTPKVALELVQFFGAGGSTTVLTYGGQVTLSTTWARYSLTVIVPSIAGKTIGTSDFFSPLLWVSGGSDNNTRHGSLGLQNNTFDFWGVQVEAGAVATPYEQKSYADELRACQRYYYRATAGAAVYRQYGIGNATSTTVARITVQLPVPMRTGAPTLNYGGNLNVSDGTAGFAVLSMSGPDYVASNLCTQIYATVASGLTQFRPSTLESANNTTSWIDFSAEL